MKKFVNDFRAFASQGKVLDLAVGVMIGGAFGKIVSSLVSDIFMPLIGLITGGVDFSNLFVSLNGVHYATLQDAAAAGAPTLNYGAFLTNVLDFFLIAFCIFMFVRGVGKLMPHKEEKKPRLCRYCMMEVNDKATRCPHCTSLLDDKKQDGKIAQ